MKLSNTHIGDILVLNHLNNSGQVYYVITDIEAIQIGTSAPLNAVFNLQGRYIGKSEGIITIIMGNVCNVSLTLQDFHKDEFPYPYFESKDYEDSVIPHEDIPLLVNTISKSEWFERTLNKDIENHGQSIYDLMKDVLKEKKLL